VIGEGANGPLDSNVRLHHRNLLHAMRNYASTTGVCRRKMLLEYFGETGVPDVCGNCDACDKPVTELIDVSESARLLLGVTFDLGERYGATFPDQSVARLALQRGDEPRRPQVAVSRARQSIHAALVATVAAATAPIWLLAGCVE
jgi:superfamily II DNA helicase RecQ